MSSSKQTQSSPIIHVFTDLGVKDIDDELLIKYLSDQNCLDLTFVFMGSDGVSPCQALAHWIREYEPTVLKKISGLIDNKISYMTISEYKEFDTIACDYALQISPMNGYTGENLTVRIKYIFAGDYTTPEGGRDSFNKQGSQDILDRFQSQDKLIDIPSVHMAKMRFNRSLLSKFSGNFRDNIVFTAFMLAFGRMDPKHPANKFAEGLINPEVGRGANYNSVMKMKENLKIDTSSDVNSKYCRTLKYFQTASRKYFKDLEDNGVKSETTEQSVIFLTEINTILQCISDKSCEEQGIEIVDIFGRDGLQGVYVSNFDVNTIPELLKPSWEFFKQNAESLTDSFNPVYDLFAGYVLIGIIKGENRINHTPQEFLQNVVQEF